MYPGALRSGISNESTKNVVYTDADIDEILVHLNASTRKPPASIDWQQRQLNLEIARLIAGAGLDTITLACPSDLGDTVELTLVDGIWKRARDHA